MHELVETMKWLGIAVGWVGALWVSWALVRVGATPKAYEPAPMQPTPFPAREAVPASIPLRAARQGQLAKVIPLRQGMSTSR